MDRKRLLKTLSYLIFFIFLVNFIAVKLYWYSAIWYFDMIMHFIGGFWVGLCFFYIFPGKNSISGILRAILFVLLVGIGWEVFEAIVNSLTVRDSFDYSDTFSDLFFDISGGLCAILYIWRKQSRLLFVAEQAQ